MSLSMSSTAAVPSGVQDFKDRVKLFEVEIFKYREGTCSHIKGKIKQFRLLPFAHPSVFRY